MAHQYLVDPEELVIMGEVHHIHANNGGGQEAELPRGIARLSYTPKKITRVRLRGRKTIRALRSHQHQRKEAVTRIMEATRKTGWKTTSSE